MVEPIRPCDVKLIIPDFIIEAVNGLIQQNWTGEQAKVTQNEILNIVSVREKDPDLDIDDKPTRDEVFSHHWLDIEDLYRAKGWDVKYDQPAYYETYDAYFVFKPKK